MESRLLKLLLIVTVFLFQISIWAAPLQRPAVMAPLEVYDWDAFNRNLQRAKSIGVVAVSTDIWWGKVEGSADQQFDWSYYDKVSNAIISAGMKWVPIFSFHQCGGNVGDTCDIPIPPWIWQKLGGDNPEQLKYKSEKGNYSTEVIALWSDDKAGEQYKQFIKAFAVHFSNKASHIEEVNISAGPSGELRYPSYNQHDDFQYPGRGFLQSYSDHAIDDFRGFVKDRYGSLDNVNAAWNIKLTSWNEIRPPLDANGFFYRKDYLNIRYGKDFTEWYNQALIKHGEFMITVAMDALGEHLPGVALGIKIPGVHWLMSSPEMPRSAEISAGLIPTHIDIFSDNTAHGYSPIIEMAKNLSREEREVVLHFTCLEMDNNSQAPNYSLAKDLVFWVSNGAGAREVTIMGENALSGGITNDYGWDNIDNAIRWGTYRGLTTLRVGNLADNDGLGFRRYRQVIDTFR
ncbi:MAG: family 14 glycosylhydrolase [Chloroflexota bacterium]|nr:family 14 glycosylhydrolase [Chloroflexota bacterium]